MMRAAASDSSYHRTTRATPTRLVASKNPIFNSARGFLLIVSLHLACLPWAFGGVDVISQIIGVVLGVIGLILALRIRCLEQGPSPTSTRLLSALLLREPAFWLGAGLLGYVAFQGFNPAYRQISESGRWWLEPVAHLRWLPSGMQVPFAEGGPWRTLLEWCGPWTLACALRLGVRQRATAVTLLRVIAINGFAIAAFGVIQRGAGSEAIFGVRSAPSAAIFATFIYRNHAAAYLNLCLAVALLLGRQALRQPARTETVRQGAPVLYFLFASTTFCAVLLTYSLAGILLAVAGTLVLTVTSFVLLGRHRSARTHGKPVLIGAAALLGLVGLIAAQAGALQLGEQMGAKLGAGSSSLEHRRLAAQQGVHMWQERSLFGWGAGCFRYGFTKYQRDEPRITAMGSGRLFWEHQHNDWLELLIELGVLGLLPLGTSAVLWLRSSWRAGVWRHPGLIWGAGGLVILGMHALVDFPLHNPAILTTATAVACLVLRWAETSPAQSGSPR